MMGQASSQPIVTRMSAPRASSSVSNCGRANERSMPASFIAVITSPCTRFAGWVPADIACAAVGSERALNHAAAICERPALCTQAKRTVFIRAHFPCLNVEPAPDGRLREGSERANETRTCATANGCRSEERRVGKEWSTLWSRDHETEYLYST